MDEQNLSGTTGDIPEPGGVVNGFGDEPPASRLSLVDLIYGLLFAPAATFQKISSRPPLGQAFIIFAAVTLIGTLITVWVPPVTDMPAEMPAEMVGMMTSIMPYLGLLGALFAFISWFILAGMFQLVSEFLDGRGTALGVFAVLGLSELPNVFGGPVYLLTSFLGKSVLATFITVSTGLLIFIWRFMLIVIGLRETQRYSTGKALITILAPGILIFLVIVVAFVALIGMMIPVFSHITG